MYTHFEALEPEKKARIQNAAMREFGKFGYEKTSAEQIARAASISKGMLFHYFGSKKGLFEYLVEESGRMAERMTAPLLRDAPRQDYLDRYRHMVRRKLRLTMENPELFEFMTMLYTRPEHRDFSGKVAAWYAKMDEAYRQMMEQMAADAAGAPFRTDIGPQNATMYIEFLMAGFTEYVVRSLQTAPPDSLAESPLWAVFDEMLDDLETLFYKPRKEAD